MRPDLIAETALSHITAGGALLAALALLGSRLIPYLLP